MIWCRPLSWACRWTSSPQVFLVVLPLDMSVSTCPLFIRTQSYWIRDHSHDMILTRLPFCKGPISKKGHILRYQGQHFNTILSIMSTHMPLPMPVCHSPSALPMSSFPHCRGVIQDRRNSGLVAESQLRRLVYIVKVRSRASRYYLQELACPKESLPGSVRLPKARASRVQKIRKCGDYKWPHDEQTPSRQIYLVNR